MAPTIAGTNCLTKAEDALVASLAESAAFQTFVGAATALAARARIHIHDMPMDLDDADAAVAAVDALRLPYAQISLSASGPLLSLRQSSSDPYFDANFVFLTRLVRFIPDGLDEQDAARSLLNDSIDIVEDLADAADTAGHLRFTSLQIADGPHRSEYPVQANLGQRQWIDIEIQKEVGVGNQ